ncbi:MAG: EAL domain-containing protein [Myxococcota bacterium]
MATDGSTSPRESGEPAALRRISEVLDEVSAQFASRGALGVLLLDASSFREIERIYGFEAYRVALGRLASLLHDVEGERLGEWDQIVRGETGRSELLLILVRDREDSKFCAQGLAETYQRVRSALERYGGRITYPYLKAAPPVHVGIAITLHNHLGELEEQIRLVLEEARTDAELNRTLAARERRRRFTEFVMAGDVYCVYEPIVEVATTTVHGYEALARGSGHPEFHMPMAMFGAAEEEGLIFQLDCLCRRKALEGARGRVAGTKLFLNIRPTTVRDPSFRAEALSQTLEQNGLCPSDLVLEISEQESIDNFSIFREVRDYYRKLGFQIALDDTGSGYGSLQSVIELSPDYIKVDRALIHGIDEDPGRQALLRALNAVAGQIRARIIAEGLDTLEELSMLSELGIPFGQGWLFGKPTRLRAED